MKPTYETLVAVLSLVGACIPRDMNRKDVWVKRADISAWLDDGAGDPSVWIAGRSFEDVVIALKVYGVHARPSSWPDAIAEVNLLQLAKAFNIE